MVISSLGNSNGLLHSLVQGRRDLSDLQRQLATGKISETYGGLDASARISVLSLRAEQSAIGGYQNIIRDVGLRVTLAQQTLSRLGDIVSQTKTDAYLNTFDIVDGQHTSYQRNAAFSFGEMVSLLNQDISGRHLFAGRDTQGEPVEAADLILEGDGTRAGLRQIIDERRQADLGASGLGRLAISQPVPTTVRLAEEAAGLPFGFSLAGATPDAGGVTLTGPAGAPAVLDVAFGAQLPTEGQSIRILVDLPDGTQETLELTATSSATPKEGEFSIGADATATAANFQAALQTGIAKLADTSLTSASAMQAAEEFFAGSKSSPPLRVSGPPFDTATVQVAGTAADTVIWYQGDDGPGAARQTAVAQIDASIVIPYGLRADEEAMQKALANLGVLAVMQFSETDANGLARYQSLTQRVGRELGEVPGVQSFSDISAELAAAQQMMEAAKERHVLSNSVMEGIISEREDISPEEVSVKILTLQTRLQASLEVTSMLSNLSLINYL
jgi:flagellin-like hook-associated protein FlgL